MNYEEREKLKDQVMDMIRTGYLHREIARKLAISRKTVVMPFVLVSCVSKARF